MLKLRRRFEMNPFRGRSLRMASALAGFDRRETVTIPSLPDVDQWNDFDVARKVMISNFSQVHAAERYRNTA